MHDGSLRVTRSYDAVIRLYTLPQNLLRMGQVSNLRNCLGFLTFSAVLYTFSDSYVAADFFKMNRPSDM